LAIPSQSETLSEVYGRLGNESLAAYQKCPFSVLSKDYFARFSRDRDQRPESGEVEITSHWTIRVSSEAGAVAQRMANDLADFLDRCMQVKLPVAEMSKVDPKVLPKRAIVLTASGGGEQECPGSFTISVNSNRILLSGRDEEGLRDSVAKLVEIIGLRQAPFLAMNEQVYKPRLALRLGAVPWLGSYRDLVFTGFNAVPLSGGDFFALSGSDAVPGLETRRDPEALRRLAQEARDARQYGLKSYFRATTVKKFPKSDAIFQKHPEIRGALTWKADGEYILCTEHPLVQQFYRETVEGIFRAAPELDGMQIIVGGEGFYHCFMRPFGVAKGHTTCPRCEALGADKVVANLCNLLADAARRANPRAEICVWPYSAVHVWSADAYQSGLIQGLKPGTALFTEIEKDECITKTGGVTKALWDYSIDLIGPGERAKRQIRLSRAAGIPVYLKSEPEISLEAPGLPHIPCLDRWFDRADALASCGADGAWVFPAFRPNYGSSAAEVCRLAWWDPAPRRDDALPSLARRIGGTRGGPHLRRAWQFVSQAIGLMPEIPPYYRGPYYLGPAHPMCANPAAALPRVFYGLFLFEAESTDADGLRLQPTFITQPGNRSPAFADAYRRMEELLKSAVAEIDAAEPLVEQRHRRMFQSECSPIRWLYHTVRTEANFYESCQLRDRLSGGEDRAQAPRDYRRWLAVLKDEKANAEAALPVMEADVRLDMYYGGDHTFSHGADMIRSKIQLIEQEINAYLPSLAACRT